MNSFLLYILKSTFCISLFYLGFRILLRKETFFRLNRILLLSAVIFSAIIPAIQLPQSIKPTARNEWMSAFPKTVISQVAQPTSEETVPAATPPTEQTKPVLKEEFTWLKLVQETYLAGILISFLILIYGIISILILFRKARFMQMDGFRLLIIDHEVPPFSFGRFVIISQADYDAHQETILAHEEAHIRLNHFFDLAVLETVKLFHWFNPVVYWLIRDMKEIHEFQADKYTLRKGIDATQYQILIIQKSVGPQRFALANSFNHCQIKKRITMMNKQKTSKARLWKVATFLPLLALLLMAFGKPGENVLHNPKTSSTVSTIIQESEKQWTEADFGKIIRDNDTKFRAYRSVMIQLNSKSQLVINGKTDDWDEASKQIQKCLDYNATSDDLKSYFTKIEINGQEIMSQRNIIINITTDVSTPKEKYQKLLNFVGNIVTETRQKYANEIYKTSYQKLTQAQRAEIIKLIPAIASFNQYPVLAPETQANRPSLYIEVRAEGIFVLPDKNVVTLDEMKQKVELFAKENGVFVDVRTAAGLKDEQVSKVKEALKDIKLAIRYLTFDPVYIQVEQMAEFPGGNDGLRDWMFKNTMYPDAAKTIGLEGKVYVSFVINSKGKSVFPKVTRGLSPVLDAEALNLISKMPEWKPAIQNGFPVSVSYVIPINFNLK